MNLFSDIAKGFKWIGHALADVTEWVPRVIKITEDVGEDAAQLMPQATIVLTDVDELALAATKDGAAALKAAATLTAAIVKAAESNTLNIEADEEVVTAFKAFIEEVSDQGNWSDVLTALQKLVTHWDNFGAAAEAALKKIEADATGN